MMNRRLLAFFLFFAFSKVSFAALQYSKIELEGCPENAYCKKAAGEAFKKWQENLELFAKNKMSEEKINRYIQDNDGLPISGWAMEEASILPRIIMWDSPCKQHKEHASKFYISDFFRKNLYALELKEFNTLYFARAVAGMPPAPLFSFTIPRDEIPTFIDGKNYYFLREEEGKYYGLYLDREGKLRVTKVIHSDHPVKDAVCPKEQIDFFNKEAPSSTFYQSYNCKDIWDRSSKSYKTMLFGRSCG